MSSAPGQIPSETAEWPPALFSVELNHDERPLWVDQPMLAGIGKELLVLLAMCVPCGVGTLIGGWYCYKWAVGAGAIGNLGIVVSLFTIVWLGASLIVIPPLWPLRLRRCWFALTTQRLIIRRPALFVFWPRIRQIRVGQGHNIRVKCIWSYLPDQTGDIYLGEHSLNVMEHVRHAPQTVDLIRHVLLHEPFPLPTVSEEPKEIN